MSETPTAGAEISIDVEAVLPDIEQLLVAWLPSQRRWCPSPPTANVRVVDHEVMVEGANTMLWMMVELDDKAVYQVPVGIALEETVGSLLFGTENVVLGRIDIGGVECMVYDALVDPALTRPLLVHITAGEVKPKSVRSMGAEQSNTSLVYDSRYVLKVFRRLHEGSNADLEVTQKLTEVDFPNIAPTIATWQRGNYDLAVCQPFLWDGTEGWKLALGSARDFFGADTQGSSATVGGAGTSAQIDPADPADAGGDFANEAHRLGVVTGELHISLSEVFPHEPFDPERLAKSLESSLDNVDAAQQSALRRLIDEVRSVSPADSGSAIRVHGDYHLGQTLRGVNGWYIFDFEGEPARPLAERNVPASGLKDVSGMLRSFHYAASTAVWEQMPADRESLMESSDAWETRNRDAFLQGYLSVHGIAKILPGATTGFETLLRGFEVEKAIYELAYEKAYRPNWVAIPQSALDRLLSSL